MSEFKGASGPWSFHEEDGEGGQIVVADNGDVVCVVGSYMTSVEEDFANGPLIAAAPELLEACLRIQAQFRQAGIASVAGSLNPIEDNAAQIDAVILKALGQ